MVLGAVRAGYCISGVDMLTEKGMECYCRETYQGGIGIWKFA